MTLWNTVGFYNAIDAYYCVRSNFTFLFITQLLSIHGRIPPEMKRNNAIKEGIINETVINIGTNDF